MQPFYFVHINKTGGSSIETLLNKPKQHFPAKLIIQQIGEAAWNNLFTFSIIRNPYDRMVSAFFYRQRVGTFPSDLTFADFIRMTLEEYQSPYYNRALMFAPCHEWVTYRGKIAVDFIARFENFEEDVKYCLRRIGVPMDKGFTLPHTNATFHNSYQTYYDEQTKSTVERHFEADFKAFNYSFEPLPAIAGNDRI